MLDISGIPGAAVYHDSAEDIARFEGRYALIQLYGENDPMRKAAERTGRGVPFDLLCWFTEDLFDVKSRPLPPDEAFDYFERFLRRCDNQVESFQHRARRTEEHNARLTEKRMEEAKDEGVQRALDIRRKAFGIPFVQVH